MFDHTCLLTQTCIYSTHSYQVVIIPIPKSNSAPEVFEAMYGKAAELRKGLEAAVSNCVICVH